MAQERASEERGRLEVPAFEFKEKGPAEEDLKREVSPGGHHASRPQRAERP